MVLHLFLFRTASTINMDLKFVTGEPALMLAGERSSDKVLVIADLHIGAEHEFRQAGIKMPSQTKKMLDKLIGLIKHTKATRLVILGDVKHKVPGLSFQEEREVPHFLNELSKLVDVEVLPGNHDDGLQQLVPDVRFHASSGLLLGDIYLSHGHTWPSTEGLGTGHIIVGHRHPVIELRDDLGYVWRERVWVRTKLIRKDIAKKYGAKTLPKRLPELVMVPAFNEMVGGTAVNRGRPSKRHLKFKRKLTPLGPLLKAADKPSARVFLLDGTYLGRLGKLSKPFS
jgi:putative SbcD/Mre11-related phosphoesterase